MPSPLSRRLAGLAVAVAAATLTPLASIEAGASGDRTGNLEGFSADRAAYSSPVISTTRVVVPMVFPVIGGATYSDTFLACRSGCTRKHLGQDLMAPKMRPLVAVFNGVISSMKSESYVGEGNYFTLTGDNGWSANYIHVNNDTPGTDDGRGTTSYAFAPGMKRGLRVVAGQLLGWQGDSGNAESTAPHTHFELRKGGPWDGVVYNAKPSLDAAARLATPRVSGPHPHGALLRSVTTQFAWLVDNGSKRHIRESVLAANGYSPAQAIKVSQAEIDSYPTLSEVRVRDGAAVRAPDGSLWLVVAGRKVAVRDLAALAALGVPATRVHPVSHGVLASLPVPAAGTPAPGLVRPGAVVRLEGDARVWMIEGTRRRLFPDWPTAHSWGYTTADVIKVPATAFDAVDPASTTAPVPPTLTVGAPMPLRDGSVTRQTFPGPVWIIEKGARRLVASSSAYRNYGYALVPIRVIPAAAVSRHPAGPSWPS